MTSREQLGLIIADANKQYSRIQQILTRAKNNPSKLSYSDKSEIKELASQFLINMNAVTPLIEKDSSLMMAPVPGIEGTVHAFSWMMWSMQWFDSFERVMKPVLF